MTAANPVVGAQPSLSIVVPARNEASSVVAVLRALRSQFPGAELVLVDNGSTDATADLASREAGVRVVSEPRPGKGRAMRAGAAAAAGTYVLFHDADFEYDVRDAGEVVALATKTGACVIGARVVAFERLRWSSWAANYVIQKLLRVRFRKNVADVLSGTRCLRRTDFLELRTCSNGFGIETELAVACLLRGVPIQHTYVRYTPRTGAQGKKIRAHHMLLLMRIALT